MTPPRYAALVIVLAAATGCGEGRRPTVAPPVPSAPGPHVRLRVPLAVLNELFAAEIADGPLWPVRLDRSGPARARFGDARILLREARLVSVESGALRVEVAVDVRQRARTLVTLTASAAYEVELERSRRGRDLYVAMRVQYGDLADGFRDDLAELRRLVGPELEQQLRCPRCEWGAVTAATDEVVAAVEAALERWLYEDLFGATNVIIDLPPIPSGAFEVTTTADVLELGLTTTLPVRAPAPPFPAPTTSGVLDVGLSGSALAELAIWANANERAPARHDRALAAAALLDAAVTRPFADDLMLRLNARAVEARLVDATLTADGLRASFSVAARR